MTRLVGFGLNKWKKTSADLEKAVCPSSKTDKAKRKKKVEVGEEEKRNITQPVRLGLDC